MMKIHYAWMIVGLLSILPDVGIAHDGTVNITGSIYASSCDVDSSSQSLPVDMGDFSSSGFSAVGDVQGKKKLSINLSNCTTGIEGATITFTGDSDSTNTALLALSDTSGGGGMASGVGIEILDKDSAQLAINTLSKQYAIAAGNNELDFYLSYMATKIPVTAGNASSVMYFDLSYQ
ncbi:fimbrial protein [Enterobacter wuhouensis]|uniref:Fimbrial protein n=2 Tax=Enterobacter wuhouensis TaxID=2529381 RepID=A0ABZ1DQA4_9ENTR|nr:fimbrial protein [Enterobacter wuhouensis]MCV2531639.1 fimbrial protein [Enterobacter wuhouensis]WRW33755.1 fimbrial protein [Enterobacter wuhouensis]